MADPSLKQAAALHNLAMAGAGQLSHQLPGEASLGARITAVGIAWTSCAENIGYFGGGGATPAEKAVSLTQSMLAEVAPNDGHRRNILSASVTRVGIDVYVDGAGTVWMTQDFSN